jgi:hypothetical protein
MKDTSYRSVPGTFNQQHTKKSPTGNSTAGHTIQLSKQTERALEHPSSDSPTTSTDDVMVTAVLGMLTVL